MKSTLLFILIYLAAGCNSAPKEQVVIKNRDYRFDSTVIQQLPLYDSLVKEILAHFPYYKKFINEQDSYRAFKYHPNSEYSDVHKELAPDIAPGIQRIFQKLGKDHIRAFDVFGDSSIKINIRYLEDVEARVDKEENLSYFPLGKKMQHREMPVKDTILNSHWQFWIRFNERRFF
jgi:hypothetical protein